MISLPPKIIKVGEQGLGVSGYPGAPLFFCTSSRQEMRGYVRKP